MKYENARHVHLLITQYNQDSSSPTGPTKRKTLSTGEMYSI